MCARVAADGCCRSISARLADGLRLVSRIGAALLFQTIHDVALMLDRERAGREAAYLDFVVEIIRRSDDQKGFEVLSRRWVVERTFGWMTRWRRFVRDYEKRIDSLRL